MQTCCNLSPIWSRLLLWDQSLNRSESKRDDGLFFPIFQPVPLCLYRPAYNLEISLTPDAEGRLKALNASGGQQRRAFHWGSAFTFMYKQFWHTAALFHQETVRCTWVFAVATPKAENISAPNFGIRNYFMVKMWRPDSRLNPGNSVEEEWVLLLVRLNHNSD